MMSSKTEMRWSDTYLLGYGSMDDMHREFVDCVAALQGCSDARVLDRLEAFEAHAERHFSEERQWMQQTKFPGAACHIDEHEAVLQSVREVMSLLRREFSTKHFTIARSLADALADWFPAHAQHLDSALSHWMSKSRFGGKPVVLRREI
jgi:hemerythrin